ncbi:MAG TPA: prolyl oligopeptidase family serine peptidase, partial [Niastella sp.]
VYPERNYNWLTSELVSWRTLDGSISQGVLYKPENFDSSRRYPLIFDYYDKRSIELNVYRIPGYSDGEINIPWFVSNGYMVFIPDIHYKIGHVGESVLNSIISAARILSSRTYIDSTRMGIVGHSFGGYETNYLLTHSTIFAAAISSAGFCDLMGMYGSLWEDGSSFSEYFELRAGRMGVTPWENREAYISNSPIFNVDKVVTPVLMMNNVDDKAVPFSQGVQFFTALRRLGKKAWMLQYEDEGHSLYSLEAKADYTIRTTQFLDHFLKGKPAPGWMSNEQHPLWKE